MSFALCTATSISPATRAASIDETNAPSPHAVSGARRSPSVVIVRSRAGTLARPSASTTIADWASASLLPRVPIRSVLTATVTGREPLRGGVRGNAREARVHGSRNTIAKIYPNLCIGPNGLPNHSAAPRSPPSAARISLANERPHPLKRRPQPCRQVRRGVDELVALLLELEGAQQVDVHPDQRAALAQSAAVRLKEALAG